jgi:hypothetical protein
MQAMKFKQNATRDGSVHEQNCIIISSLLLSTKKTGFISVVSSEYLPEYTQAYEPWLLNLYKR